MLTKLALAIMPKNFVKKLLLVVTVCCAITVLKFVVSRKSARKRKSVSADSGNTTMLRYAPKEKISFNYLAACTNYAQAHSQLSDTAKLN